MADSKDWNERRNTPVPDNHSDNKPENTDGSSRRNPFLPYERLDALAHERRNFLTAVESLVNQQASPNQEKELVSQIAQQVLEQMRPQVEACVRRVLTEHKK